MPVDVAMYSKRTCQRREREQNRSETNVRRYGEFCVSENPDADRDAVATDYNAVYWETRFGPRPPEAAGPAVASELAKIVTAGKYRRVLRDAGVHRPDDASLKAWAALGPSDLLDDPKGKLARAVDGARAARAGGFVATVWSRRGEDDDDDAKLSDAATVVENTTQVRRGGGAAQGPAVRPRALPGEAARPQTLLPRGPGRLPR